MAQLIAAVNAASESASQCEENGESVSRVPDGDRIRDKSRCQ